MPGPDGRPRACVVTFGCPKNETDSEGFAAALDAAGYLLVDQPEEAQLLLLNTCAFIAPAVEESTEYLLEAMEWQSRVPGRKLVLAGCLPARFADDGSGGLEEVDLVIGPGDTRGLLDFLNASAATSMRLPVESRVYRYLKISDGCSNRCAFCTIPRIRGPYRPVAASEVLELASVLVGQGASEVGLVGQDCGVWRGDGMDLGGLLSRLAGAHPDVWWRGYYIHPAHLPPDLLPVMESTENVMPYLDLPMQHVSDGVLRRMGRGYGEAELHELLRRVEESSRDIAVRATVIAGYPGETESDFQRLLDFLDAYPAIRNLVAFPYYSERGTVESRRDHDRPGRSVVDARLRELSSVSEAAYLRWEERLFERPVRILVDAPGIGHTMYDAPGVDAACRIRGPHPSPGRFAEVEVISAEGSDIFVSCTAHCQQGAVKPER